MKWVTKKDEEIEYTRRHVCLHARYAFQVERIVCRYMYIRASWHESLCTRDVRTIYVYIGLHVIRRNPIYDSVSCRDLYFIFILMTRMTHTHTHIFHIGLIKKCLHSFPTVCSQSVQINILTLFRLQLLAIWKLILRLWSIDLSRQINIHMQ